MMTSTKNIDTIEEIKIRQAYLEGVLESAPDAIVTLDTESTITGWNKKAEKMFGYTSAEAIGKNVDDLLAHDDTALYKEAINFSIQISTKQSVGPMETIRYRKDGTPLHVILSGSPVSVNDNFEGSVAIYTDITKRVQVEHKLQKSEERFQAIFEQAAVGVAQIVSKTGDFVSINQRYADIVGYSIEEMEHLTFQGITHPEDLQENLNLMQRLLDGDICEFSMEKRCFHKNGAIVWVNLTVSPLWEIGEEPDYHIEVVEDITERKRVKDALTESHKRLLTVLDGIDADVYVSDMDTYEILFMNQHMRASFNGNMVGKICWQMFRGETGPCPHCTNNQLIDADGEPTGVVTWEGQNPITRRWYINKDRAINWVDDRLVRLQIATDVTALKRTETALRKSEERYRLVSDLTSDYAYAYSVDDDGNLVNEWVTGAFERITGYTKHELQSLGGWEKLIYGQDLHLPMAQRKALLKGQEKTVEYRIQTKDGQIRWMLDYAIPVWDEKNEQVTSIYGAVQDITKRRQAEDELRASEWRFRTLVEQSPFGIQVFDSEGTLEQANNAWEEIWGAQADEMIGRLNALQDAQIQESGLLPSIQQSFSGKAVSLPDTLYDPAASGLPGRKRWIRTNAYPVKDQDGHVLKVVVINQDVSKQKIVEQALKESENKFRSITENAIDYIFIKDKDRKYTFANNAMQDLLGLPEDEILGKTPDEVFGTKQATAIKNVDDRAFSGEVVNETRSLVINDQTLYLNTIQTPLTMNNGEVTSIMGIVRDVTEQMRAEEALRASEEKYRTLFEHANDAIFLENNDDEIIDVNQQACELMGYTRDELLQMTVPDLQAPEVRGKKGTVLKQELENYRGELFESLNLRRDGTKIPVEISTASLPGKDTGLVLAIIRDITERKRIDLEIRDNASRMGALLEIEKALTSTLDLDEVLDIIMTEMEKVIPYHSISLQILQNNSLKILACRGFDQPNNVIELSFPLDPKYPNHHVIKTREALAIEDVAQEYPHFQSQSTRYMSGHIRCWLGVPLISKGKVDGMITLDRSEAIPFSKAEIQLATAIASQAALAIENASLFSEAQLRLERLSSLRRIDQTISSSMDLQVTLGILLGQVLHQLQIDAAAVLLFRPELQSLQFIAGQGFHTQALQFTDLRLGQGFAGRAALEQRTVKVNNLATTQTGFLRSPEFRTEGFVTYIGVPLIAKGNITGVLEIYHRQNLEPDLEWMVFLETLAGQAAIAIDNIRLFEDLQTSNLQLRQAYDATIEGWAQALELRDMETKGHSHRAVELTQALARKMGIGDRKLAHIRWGVLLHDIGKMGVPDAILQKNGPLTEEEWEIMREHPLHAYKWLAPISYLRPALDIPYCHHEKWDGTGYPQGLKEERIPLSARIFAVVDVWDALLSDRPYRKAWPQKKALAYLREQSGQHFDPQVVEAFIEMLLHEGHLT